MCVCARARVCVPRYFCDPQWVHTFPKQILFIDANIHMQTHVNAASHPKTRAMCTSHACIYRYTSMFSPLILLPLHYLIILFMHLLLTHFTK